jgi:hypothetical protein
MKKQRMTLLAAVGGRSVRKHEWRRSFCKRGTMRRVHSFEPAPFSLPGVSTVPRSSISARDFFCPKLAPDAAMFKLFFIHIYV